MLEAGDGAVGGGGCVQQSNCAVSNIEYPNVKCAFKTGILSTFFVNMLYLFYISLFVQLEVVTSAAAAPGTGTFRSRERNCLVTFVLMNCRLLQLSLYWGVGLLGTPGVPL